MKKLMIVGIIILLVGMSIPSTGINIERTTAFFNGKILCGGGSLVYGLCDDPNDNLDGIVVFDPDDPENLTLIKPGTWYVPSGGCFVPPHYMYFTKPSNGILCRLNLETLLFEEIGGGGAGIDALTYDSTTNTIYGGSSDGFTGGLWIIDPETGSQEYVGDFTATSWVVGMACNSDGDMYAWDISPDYFYSIDKETGEATPIGPLGINIGFGGDGAFDYETDNLYLAAYTSSGYYLYECDEDTGECTLIGEFQNNTVIIPLIIPYNFSNKYPIATFNWKPTPPEPGVTIFFNASESYDPDGYISLYEWDWDNDGIFDESHTNPMATHAWPDYGFYSVSLKITDNSSIKGTTTKIVRVGNQPPNEPIINGTSKGKVGLHYNYTFKSTDPDGDNIYYHICWGDTEIIYIYGPYKSGKPITLSYNWTQKGTYIIQCKTRDIYELESNWTYLEVTMPKSHNWFMNYLNKFPLLLRLMEGLIK